MLVNRYLKDNEIQEIALEVSEAATEGRNNAVSSIIRTYFDPVREAAMELYGVDLIEITNRLHSQACPDWRM